MIQTLLMYICSLPETKFAVQSSSDVRQRPLLFFHTEGSCPLPGMAGSGLGIEAGALWSFARICNELEDRLVPILGR